MPVIDTLTISAEYLAAAVFLDATITLESMAAELVEQLRVRVPGFGGQARDAVAAELSDEQRLTTTSFEREMLRVLPRRRTAGRRMRLLIDGRVGVSTRRSRVLTVITTWAVGWYPRR